MKVPLLDLKIQYRTIQDQVQKVIAEVCESQQFILGPQLLHMEEKIAAYCTTAHAIGVSSGSDALIISLMAARIGAGDIVLTTPYTFFATAGAVARVGAQTKFVDIDAHTYNIDPLRLAQAIEDMPETDRRRVRAVIPVHLYGQCADMDPILEIARRHNLVVIEDAAQAIGAEYKQQRAGSMGHFGCFSFFPSKNLGAFGDGGVVTTGLAEYDRMLRLMRVHGMEPKYYHLYVGGNFRLDALQAAIVSIKLAYLDQWTMGRQRNATTYRRLFDEAGLADVVRLPREKENRHIYNQFVIRVKGRRDALREYLISQGVGCEVYYPVPLHLQACFADLGYCPGDFPVAEEAALQTLALPIYPELTSDQLNYVVDRIHAFFKQE